MFGIGMPEILLILAIALIVIGPKKLPGLAKTLGRAMGEFKKATQDFKRSIDMEETIREFNEPVDPLGTNLKDAVEDAEKEKEEEKAEEEENVEKKKKAEKEEKENPYQKDPGPEKADKKFHDSDDFQKKE